MVLPLCVIFLMLWDVVMIQRCICFMRPVMNGDTLFAWNMRMIYLTKTYWEGSDRNFVQQEKINSRGMDDFRG